MRSHKSKKTLDPKSNDEAAIRTLYQQMIDGWNKGSGQAFAAPYTDDSDFIGFDGTYMKGRQQIASFHQMLFDKFLKGSSLIGKIRSVRFIAENVAVMIAVGGTVMAGQSDIEPERNSIHTIVAVKRDSNWCLTAFQNSRVQYVGIDYGSILKTKLGIVAIENNREMAREKIQVSRGMPEEQFNEFAIYGTPEDVFRQIELFEEAGIHIL